LLALSRELRAKLLSAARDEDRRGAALPLQLMNQPAVSLRRFGEPRKVNHLGAGVPLQIKVVSRETNKDEERHRNRKSKSM